MCLNFMMYYPRLNFTKCQGYERAGAAFARKYGGGYVIIIIMLLFLDFAFWGCLF